MAVRRRRSARTLAAALVALATIASLAALHGPDGASPAAGDMLQSNAELEWYRGNIHTHSLWSDGDDYLEMIALWYREHDYDFLCFTDHNVLANSDRWSDVEKNKGGRRAYEKLKARFPGGWVDERMHDGRLEVRLKTFLEVNSKIGIPDEFLLIQGEEITDRFRNLPVHMNATNLQDLIPPLHGESVYEVMQNNTNALIAQRERTGQPMLIHLNHPNFGYGVTAEDLMRVRGENFFEVYNGHPGVHNSGDEQHASTERIWDVILTQRLTELELPLMYGIATDDGHNYHNIPSRASEPGRGWVVVLAAELTPASLIEAMERGRFYASSGVALSSVSTTSRDYTVAVDSEPGVDYTIEFIGTRKGFDRRSEPVLGNDGEPLPATRRYSDDVGELLQSVDGPVSRYEFAGDEIYVRARVISTKRHPNPSEVGEFERAWTQPVRGPGA